MSERICGICKRPLRQETEAVAVHPLMEDTACNGSGSHYHPDCSRCWLGPPHTWEEHYLSLCHYALAQCFGPPGIWHSENERAMREVEREWWAQHAPYPWQERYSQVPEWPSNDRALGRL